MKKERQANFELLRVIAMLMIIVLHYLVKGGVAAPYEGNETPINYLAWLIEAFCIVSVNCYVLISGYFLVESEWKWNRVFSLLGQILFYALLVPVVLIGIGEITVTELGVYDWIGFLFPIGTEQYWFATAYLLMYLFAPLLAAGIRQLDKKSLQIIIALLLLFFAMEKSAIPVSFVTDRAGYDFGWFLCLFVIAGYISRFGISWLENRKHAIAMYIFMCVAIWGLSLVSHALSGSVTAFSYYEDMPYTYNHIFCLIASVALFYVFKDTNLPDRKWTGIVCTLAPYTFGVYLLHEHVLIRYRWVKWLQVDKVAGSPLFLIHMAVCALLIYTVGTIVDFVRKWIFETITATIRKK